MTAAGSPAAPLLPQIFKGIGDLNVGHRLRGKPDFVRRPVQLPGNIDIFGSRAYRETAGLLQGQAVISGGATRNGKEAAVAGRV